MVDDELGVGSAAVSELALVAERGVVSLSDEAREEARRRAEVIGPLALRPSVSHRAADAAGEQLGLGRRQVYVMISRWRQGSGLVTDLAVAHSDGGRGRGRLSAPVEAVIAEVLRARYLKRQRPTLAVVHREVSRVCRARGLAVPARNTVASRIVAIDPVEVVQARDGPAAARGLRVVAGTPPTVAALLEQIQIDHTVIDLIVVDERDRLPLGSPQPPARRLCRSPCDQRKMNPDAAA